MRTAIVLVLLAFCSVAAAEDFTYTKHQKLIIASFELNVEGVKRLLREGADLNATMGKHPRDLFMNQWSLGWPVASGNWTPLLAVAHSHREPQPDRPIENTSEARKDAERRRLAIPAEVIQERDEWRVKIAKLLIEKGAKLDAHDGFGATALAAAVYRKYDSLAYALLDAGANPNTKTGVYIDGTGDITPLHRASDRLALTQALIKRGAKVNVQDSTGETPLHWAVRDLYFLVADTTFVPAFRPKRAENASLEQLELIKTLVVAGADWNQKNRKGETPADALKRIRWGNTEIKTRALELLELKP